MLGDAGHRHRHWLATVVRTGAAPPAPSDDLTIVIVEGEGGINNIKKGIATKPVVEVHDRNKRPLAGALVTFTLPNYGASGTFADGSQVFTVTTDAAGRASAAFGPMALPASSKSMSKRRLRGTPGPQASPRATRSRARQPGVREQRLPRPAIRIYW